MGRPARIVETCPECGVDFVISPIIESGRTPYKVCPEGHETALPKLVKSRKSGQAAPSATPSVAPKAAPKEKSVLLRAREVSIAGQRSAEHLAAVALIGCYEKLLATTPKLSHGVINGVFEKTVQTSRQILGLA